MHAVGHTTVSDGESAVEVTLARAHADTPDLVRTLLDLDLKSYAEPTFSEHTAVALSGHAAIFLLLADRRCVGSAVFVRDFDHPSDAVLLATGVLPGWRGRGLGEWMIAGALGALREVGLEAALVHVGARNQRAVNAYQEAGFVLDQTLPDPTDPADHRLILRASLRG